MPTATCEFPLKPVVMHRNKQWEKPQPTPDLDLGEGRHYLPECGTEYRHCSRTHSCIIGGLDEADCPLIPVNAGPVLDISVFDAIDLALPTNDYQMVVTKQGIEFIKLTMTDRELLSAYISESDTHILSQKLAVLQTMLLERGYTLDPDEARMRLS